MRITDFNGDKAISEVRSENNGGGPEIVVRPSHRLPKALLRLVALSSWVAVGLAFNDDFLARGVHSIPILVLSFMLVLWLAVGVVIAIDLLWILFGVQQVSIRSEDLTVTRKIGRASSGKSETFVATHVRGMRIEERKYKRRGKTTVNCAITFDYLGKKRVLLGHLSPQHADSLLSGPLNRFASN